MKNNKISIAAGLKQMLLLLGLGCAAFTAQGTIIPAMSGTVTIDNASPASATNFQNWFSFWRSLQGLGRTDLTTDTFAAGITGPLTVNVKTSNTTAETSAVLFPAITGMSSTNTITIDGGGNTFWYSGTNAAIRFSGGDYFTIKNLIVRNSSTTPGGIWFTNQSDYNTITGCEVFLSNLTSANSSTYYISMSTSVTSATANGTTATGTTGQPGSFNTITGCKFYTQSGSPGPYYAISMNGNTANYSSIAQNNTFTNNVISNFNYMGVYTYYPNGNIISGNDISRSNATAGGQTTLYGIYTYYPYCTNRSSEISGNNIHDLPFAGATTSTTNLSSIYGTYVYYPYGNATNTFKMNGNTFKNIFYTTGSRYVNYVYYAQYIDITNNVIDNVDGTATSSTSYDWYIYYPTAIKCNGNTCTNSNTNGYLYNFYMYYGAVGAYTWNEFQDNVITNNTTVNYLYSAYLYYYNGANSYKVNRNYVVGNAATGSTGYFYFYLYYFYNYEVTNNVVAGNRANSKYIYLYSGLSGSYTAEIRNNTFEMDATSLPTPGSAYCYMYFYLYYHTVWFTGNIISVQGPSSGTLPYYRYMYMYMSYNNPSNLKEFDNNTYHVNAQFQYPYWYFNGNNYTDWPTFSTSGFAGPNDNGVDPKFIDKPNNDWRAGAWSTQNTVPFLAINTKDGLEVDRNKTRHDRGGLETPTDLEAVSTNFTVPPVVCAGYTTSGGTNIVVKSNYQYDQATNFNVSYSVNGGPKISTKVTKKLALGDTVKAFFSKPLTLNDYGVNRVAIFVDLPDDDNSNDSFIFTTFVKPAPGGGKYVFSPKPTQTVYQYTKVNDVTVLNQPVIYNSAAPRVYSNSTYGTDWVASGYAITAGGVMRPGSEITYFPAATGKDLEIQFKTTDKNMEDTIIWVCLKVVDLNNGCDTTIKRQVLIYPTVVPKFSFPAINCDGDNILFENTSKVRSGSMEFLWDFGTGKVADQTETPEPFFTFPASGTYKVKLVAKTLPYGFPSYDSAMITVRKKPVTKFTYTNACQGAALTFNSAGTTPTASLSWSFGDNTTSTQANPTKQYTKTGGYMVAFTATENGCSETVNKRVYQFDKPKALWSLISGTCDNEGFVFSNTSTIPTGTVGSYWDFNDGTVSAEKDPVHDFTSSGMKNVKLIAVSEFGCKDSLIKPINVKESPKVAFSYSSPCSLTPTDFSNETPTVAGAIANYSWVFSDGGATAAKSPSYLFKSIGPKTATLTVLLDNGCKETLTKDLVVGVQPKARFDAANVCTGYPVIFENKTEWVQGDISYNWNFGDGNFTTERAPKKEYNVSITTTYTVTLTASIAGGCSDQVTKQITVNEGPKTCDFAAGTDYANSFYGMKMEAIDGNGVPTNQGGVTYTWVIESGGNKKGSTVQHDFKKDGEYAVTMVARVDATGCECSKTRTVVMNRNAAEELSTTGLTLYPNPNAGMFQIAVSEGFGSVLQIEISSMNGSKVRSLEVANNGLVQVNAGDLADGVYLVRVSSGEQVATRKVTIHR